MADESVISLEETNRIRAKLGLKPLVDDSAEKQAAERKAKQEAREAAQEAAKREELLQKIERKKRKRAANAKLQGKGLAEEDADDLSASAWVQKSRELAQQRKAKLLAARRARMLDEQDALEDTSHLEGVKVAHSIDKFGTGEDIILTLKDKGVLAGDDLNEDADELENLQTAEQEKIERKLERKKMNPLYDAAEYLATSASVPLLPQYDEEEREKAERKRNSFVLSGRGDVLAAGNAEQDELQNMKVQLAQAATIYDLDGGANIASEYYTKQELLSFRKRRRTTTKKKMRKKKRSQVTAKDLLQLEEEEAAMDRGSRTQSIQREKQMEEDISEHNRREASYAKALSKAAEQSRLRLGGGSMDVDEDDDADEELNVALSLARRRKQVQRQSEAELAAAIAKRRSSEKDDDSKDKSGLVFTDTTEFCRSLNVEHTRAVEPPKPDSPEEKPATPEPVFQEVAIKDADEFQPDDEDDKKEEEEEEETDFVSVIEEPLVAQGIGATLKLMKEKGMSDHELEIFGGRRTDQMLRADDVAPNIKLERKDEFGRDMTPKEAFRKLSHRFHGKMPGKNKQEKRMRQYREELKMKAMKATDTPLQTAEAFRAAQRRSQQPFVLIQGGDVSRFASVDESVELKKKPKRRRKKKSKARAE